jgi:hypothetical protein
MRTGLGRGSSPIDELAEPAADVVAAAASGLNPDSTLVIARIIAMSSLLR